MAERRDEAEHVSLLDRGDQILEVLPEDGSKISRRRITDLLRKRFGTSFADDEFDQAFNHMAALGRIRARPGLRQFLQRTAPVEKVRAWPASQAEWRVEQNLYPPAARYVRLALWRDPNLDLNSNVFVAITGNHGHRRGTQAQNPDLLLISRSQLGADNQIELDVTTIEVKPQHTANVQSVFQAANQAMAAHRGYLLWHCGDRIVRRNMLPYFMKACDATRVGLIVAEDPNDMSSYRIERGAPRRHPSPSDVQSLLTRCLSPNDKAEFEAWSATKVQPA